MLKRRILAPLLIAVLLAPLVTGIAQAIVVSSPQLYFEPEIQEVLVGQDAIIELKLFYPGTPSCNLINVTATIHVPTPLELVSFEKYRGSALLLKQDITISILYKTTIYYPEEGNYTLAQLIVRAYKPGGYLISGLYHIECSTDFGATPFDGELQATVIVKPKPRRAPLAIGAAGLLLLVGGLVAPLPPEQRQVMLVLASIFILATLLMTAGILPTPF